MKNKCLEMLVAEHRTILRAIDVLCAVLNKVLQKQPLRPAAVFRNFG